MIGHERFAVAVCPERNFRLIGIMTGEPVSERAQLELAPGLHVPSGPPVVVVGPNGAGKTRFAAELAKKPGIELVGALRNIQLPDALPRQALDKARQQLRKTLGERAAQYWSMSNEIAQLFSKLLEEDAASAVAFRDSYDPSTPSTPDETTLTRLRDLWSHLFPGRSLQFNDYKAQVTSTLTGEQTYPAQRMSDGERVALYLAARALDTDAEILIIDEPEVHFHGRLAARFWNALESVRPDCQFVYITHDLPFALSRADATFVLVLPGRSPQLLDLEAGLPTELTEALLSAASFSVHARRIIFCEGNESSSLDVNLYTSWFHDESTAVIPVGDSRSVVRAAEAFSNTGLVAGVECIGVIDRDFWPDRYLESLPSNVVALPVHEVENLLALPVVVVSVARHLGRTPEEAEQVAAEAQGDFRSRVTDEVQNYVVAERVKRRIEGEFFGALNGIDVRAGAEAVSTALAPSAWASDPAAILREERERLDRALGGDTEEFAALVPGKVYWKRAAKCVGMEPTAYRDLVLSALTSGHPPAVAGALDSELNRFLPARQV